MRERILKPLGYSIQLLLSVFVIVLSIPLGLLALSLIAALVQWVRL